MTNEEIHEVMKKPRRAGLVSQYKKIWKQATGEDFRDCLCGNGFNRLYNLCLNYDKKINKK